MAAVSGESGGLQPGPAPPAPLPARPMYSGSEASSQDPNPRQPRFRLQNRRLERERPQRDIAEAGPANEGGMAGEADKQMAGHLNTFGTVCVELGWLDYTLLDMDLCPFSDLRGLLQLLHWNDLSQISCLERSEAYGALRQLVSFYKHQQAYDGAGIASEPIEWPDLCTVCLAALNGYESRSCVMCENSAICQGCEYAIPEEALKTVYMRRFRWDEQTGMEDESAVQPGDILCLECCTAGASVEQMAKGHLFQTFRNVCDWSFGNGHWHPDNRPRLFLQASFDGASLHLLTLCGELLARIQASPADPLATIRIPPAAALTGAPGRAYSAVDVILPDGELLGAAPAGATVADAFGFPVLSGISFVE